MPLFGFKSDFLRLFSFEKGIGHFSRLQISQIIRDLKIILGKQKADLGPKKDAFGAST